MPEKPRKKENLNTNEWVEGGTKHSELLEKFEVLHDEGLLPKNFMPTFNFFVGKMERAVDADEEGKIEGEINEYIEDGRVRATRQQGVQKPEAPIAEEFPQVPQEDVLGIPAEENENEGRSETPAETRSKLRETVGKIEDLLGKASVPGEWATERFANLDTHLNEQSDKLREAAKGFGSKAAAFVHSTGEKIKEAPTNFGAYLDERLDDLNEKIARLGAGAKRILGNIRGATGKALNKFFVERYFGFERREVDTGPQLPPFASQEDYNEALGIKSDAELPDREHPVVEEDTDAKSEEAEVLPPEKKPETTPPARQEKNPKPTVIDAVNPAKPAPAPERPSPSSQPKKPSVPAQQPQNAGQPVSPEGDSPERMKAEIGEIIDGSESRKDASEKIKKYLKNRNGELDKKAEGFGSKVEKMFHSLGEKYNKMPLKWKLAIGVGLGVGAAFAGPFSAIFAGGIALQRAAGLAGMYVKSKNILQKMSEGTHRGFFAKGEYKGLFAHDYHEFFKDKSETQRKWIAFAMAGVYTAGMGLAIGEAVHYAPQFLHHMLGHDGGVDGGAVQSGGNVPEWMHPAQMPTHTEMPNLSVDASAGHGYEFMAKRLWEQAQAQHLDPSKYAADSDMHKLLTADAHSIDKVVHQIAADPKHAFFNHDGTSVMIDPHAHMTIGADGNIHVGAEVHAAAGAHTTPVYPHHEAPVAHAEAPATVEAHHAPDSSVADVKHDLTNENVIDHQSPTHDAPHAAPEVEQLAGQILHHHGIDIPTAEPHIYADNHTKHLFVFGGKPGLEQTTLIKNYLSANPDKIVYGTDDSGKYRIPFHWFQKPDGGGDIVPGIPVQKRGFLGFFKSFMGAPDPKEFHAKIS